MTSQKSAIADEKTARTPQRARGQRRVAALLDAARDVFAAKGYEAATMTEIAAGAGAPIGSLYQFFPSKESLADALLAGFRDRLVESLEEVRGRASDLSPADLADALLAVIPRHQAERAAVLALIDARPAGWPAPGVIRRRLRAGVSAVLLAHRPGAAEVRAEALAAVVLQLMKDFASLSAEEGMPSRALVLEEVRALTRLAIEGRL